MRKKITFYPGDKVKTNKKFKPWILDSHGNGELFDTEGRTYEGIIIGKRANYLLVDLQEEFPFTHMCEDILQKCTGVSVEENEIDLVESYESDDESKKAFVSIIRGNLFLELQELPRKIFEQTQVIARNKTNMRDLESRLREYEKDNVKAEFTIVELEGQKKLSSLDIPEVEKQYDKMMKNKKIKSIEIINENSQDPSLLVTTDDLTFRDKTRDLPEFILGAYKILIPTNRRDSIRAVNYKKTYNKSEYSHPCISQFNICLGADMIRELDKLRAERNYINVIHILINFLEEPNYGSPHIDARLFMCAQDVTIRPRNKEDWFNLEYWRENEKWDGDRFDRESRETRARYTGNRI